MNRKQRRIVQSQQHAVPSRSSNAVISINDKPYTFEQAQALAAQQYGTGNLQEALAIFDLIINSAPNVASIYYGRGYVLHVMNRLQDALASYEKAIALGFHNPDAYNNRGVILQATQRYHDALASYDQAIAIRPDYAEAYNNRGTVLEAMRKNDEAVKSYEKAIMLNPNNADTHNNRAISLEQLKCYEEALSSYQKALALNPNIPYASGSLFFTKMLVCHWQDYDATLKTLTEKIMAGLPASNPFPLLATPLPPAQLRRCAEIFTKYRFPSSSVALWKGEKYAHERIRIGYFSSDFRNHALSYLMAEFFELHDRSQFEITAFSFGPSANDAMRQRLEHAFDRFIDVSANSDAEIATLARKMEIDIAVNLNGFSAGSRAGIFAFRPAPVQVSYMGYPGTTGADYMDYLVADTIVVPSEHQVFYSEKIVHLPHSYWVIDSTRKRYDKYFTRTECNLPENGFVFCCFNNSYKITPDVFDIWMRLLHQVKGSVLWLLKSNKTAEHNLCEEAQKRGVSKERLVFAERLPLEEHLARHQLADLFLDTFYYNAHTTASDALWEGLPVLTCLGGSFTGRVAASLLHASRLPELIFQAFGHKPPISNR